MSEIESLSTPSSSTPSSSTLASSTLASSTLASSTLAAPPSERHPSGGDPAMAELLELFDGPLREVAFPDVSRDTLHALSTEVDGAVAERERRAATLAEASEVLAQAEAAVAAARAALRESEAVVDERQRALLARGQRALSYAKVFAETDPGLHARLSAISLSRIAHRGRTGAALREARPRSVEEAAPAPPRKRGRPPKAQPVDASVSS